MASKMSLKLNIDPKANKVLFAEAGKDFVDFLFSLLHLPPAATINLLKEAPSLGCMENLYNSLKTLNAAFMDPNHKNKDLLLKPRLPFHALNIPLSLPDTAPPQPPAVKQLVLYRCSHSDSACSRSVTESHYSMCNSQYIMTQSVSIINPKNDSKPIYRGYVKGEIARYIVMDDLSVSPISSIETVVDALYKLNVKDFGGLHVKAVHVGVNEGLALLKACLESKAALTQVFLVKQEEDMDSGTDGKQSKRKKGN